MPYDKSRFTHVRTIGNGYFCIVQEIERISDRKHFAYKELKSEHKANSSYRYRLKREIELVIDLEECNSIISAIEYSLSMDTGDLWYIMPLAETYLFQYIRRYNTTLTNEDRFGIINQVLASIAFAHSKEILHRDISPRNVLIFTQDDKTIKFVISDFGLGKDSTSLSHYTLSGQSGYGAAYYVSPEQKENLKNATHKSDIYSLGKLMYFIMTGKDPIDNYECEISSIIYRCINEDPNMRYPDAKSLIDHFTSVVSIREVNEFPFQTTTLSDYLRNVQQFSWDVFHPIAKEGLYYNHPFDDYVEPAVLFFNKKTSLLTYYFDAVGSDFNNFMNTFIKVLDVLDKRTGWPFSFNSDIGKLLASIYKTIPNLNVKHLCLNRLWLLGFIYDQWSVQNELLSILQADIPESLILQFTHTIHEKPRVLDINKVMSSRINQYQIKQAMIECHSKGKQIQEEEEEKRRKSLGDINFV